MKQTTSILFIVLAILLVIFTLQNHVDVNIKLFLWEINSAPLVLVMLACLFFGYLLATLYQYPRLWKTRRELKKLIRFNEELKKLHEMDHPSKVKSEEDPEGIEMDDEEDNPSFFKD